MDDMLLKEDLNHIKNSIVLGIIILLTILLFYLCYQAGAWYLDQKSINKQLDQIYDIVKIEEVSDDEKVEIVKPIKDKIDVNDPYWDYTKMSLIDVDIKDLKQINESTRGWIQVNGTNVNYPFVQGGDNSYYLNHSFNGSPNGGGWVFMDYRNNVGELDRNTILYAHARRDKSLFGSLKNILTSGWLQNRDNFIIKMSTEQENTMWQVFSVYKIPTTNDYIRVNFSSDNEFLEFSKVLLERSVHNFGTTVNGEDKIITLSTCYGNTEKVVLHAKHIKVEKK